LILEDESVLRADKTIRRKPDTPILKLKPGDNALSRADFSLLSKALFDGIELRVRIVDQRELQDARNLGDLFQPAR
jgi:hypothetical protein